MAVVAVLVEKACELLRFDAHFDKDGVAVIDGGY